MNTTFIRQRVAADKYNIKKLNRFLERSVSLTMSQINVQCPRLANTQKKRRWRHSSMALQKFLHAYIFCSTRIVDARSVWNIYNFGQIWKRYRQNNRGYSFYDL